MKAIIKLTDDLPSVLFFMLDIFRYMKGFESAFEISKYVTSAI